MLFEKFYHVSYTWEASIIIEAKNSNDAEDIFLCEFDGQDLDTTQVPPEAGVFVEPVDVKPVPYRKDLIAPGSEDEVYILVRIK